MKPEDSMSRSPTVASPTSPVIRPSTNILPTGTAPAMLALPADQVDADAVLGQHDVLCCHTGTRRERAFARRCRHVPCTGITLRGRTPL